MNRDSSEIELLLRAQLVKSRTRYFTATGLGKLGWASWMLLAIASFALLVRGADPIFLKVTTTSPQHTGLSFRVTVTAHAADESQTTTFNGPLTITASGATDSLPVIGGTGLFFTNGLWSGAISIETNAIGVTLHGETTNGAFGDLFPLNVLPLKLTQIALSVEDMIWDPTRQRIFASVGSSVPIYSNSVVRIHPDSGAIEASVSVGPITTPANLAYYQDGKLALSDNGQYLYVAVSNATAIQRVDLTTMTAGSTFAVGQNGSGILSVADMEVIPTQPLSLAVARTRYDIYEGIVVFDNGVPRANMAGFSDQFYSLAPPPSPSLIYALGTPGFSRLNLAPSGISLQDGLGVSGTGAGTRISLEYEGGLCFVNSGAVIDPAVAVMLKKLSLPSNGTLVAPDMARRRVSYLGNLGSSFVILPNDLDASLALKPFTLPNAFYVIRSFLRCGTNMYAFSTSEGKINLVQSPLLTPSALPSDVSVTQISAPAPVIAGSNVMIALAVSNAGPALATDVSLTDLLDTNVVFVSASASQGFSTAVSGKQVSCNLGNLGAGSNATLTLTVRPNVGGWLINSATVLANETDTNAYNNVISNVFFSRIISGSNSVNAIRLATLDIICATNTGRIYASVPSNSPVVSNAIVSIDLATGLFDSAVLPVNDPGRLAISDDSQKLYVAVAGNSVQQVDLPALNVASFTTLSGSRVIQDMKVLPGNHGSLALSWQNGSSRSVQIYDNGVARPMSPVDSVGGQVLEFGAIANVLYANGREASGLGRFRSFEVQAGGLTNEWSLTNALAQGEDIRFDSGFIYGSRGKIINTGTRQIVKTLSGLSTDALVAPARSAKRVFYLNKIGAAWFLQAYDANTLSLIGSLSVSNVLGTPSRLFQWGTDGFVFRTSNNQVFVLRTDLGADSDADGMPDSWEAAYGFDIHSAADAFGDADGDGMANEYEYRAGTNPTNAASVFRLTQKREAGGLRLGFLTVSGRNYRIERSQELPSLGWTTEVDNIVGIGFTQTFLVTMPAASFTRFYRAVLVP